VVEFSILLEQLIQPILAIQLEQLLPLLIFFPKLLFFRSFIPTF